MIDYPMPHVTTVPPSAPFYGPYHQLSDPDDPAGGRAITNCSWPCELAVRPARSRPCCKAGCRHALLVGFHHHASHGARLDITEGQREPLPVSCTQPRLLELFLHEKLRLPAGTRPTDEADRLEHAINEATADRIAAEALAAPPATRTATPFPDGDLSLPRPRPSPGCFGSPANCLSFAT